MGDDKNILLQFWGKTPARPGDPPEQFHPAIYHMLDVALVAEALLQEGVAPRMRQALAHAWAGCEINALFAWLPFLIALHDLGKISAAFQGQAKVEATRLQRERLLSHIATFPPAYGRSPYHAEISAIWLHDHLREREVGASPTLMWALRDAMSGHHGKFTQEGISELRARLHASERGDARWSAWRNASYTMLRELLNPHGQLTELGIPRKLRAATISLTGFIIICDWIGSNSSFFEARPQLTPEAYLTESRRRAASAILQAGLAASRAAPEYTSFEQLFARQPRALQEAIEQLAEIALEGPLLAVIEAPTGEGKTEAALVLARRLGAHRGQDELFFALPTMATSNQMFKRLSEFYYTLYEAHVKLTHSQAMVVEEELRRAILASDQDSVSPTAGSALAALDWFAGPKKALLAPFGVGTVDQVELAGLNVRHYMLRLFALAGKIVVVDEVHAYDTYMSVILEHTLAWLASLGTSVILLSATLPSTRHRALATSYLRGLEQSLPEPTVPPNLPYPAVSIYSARGEQRLEQISVFRPDQRFTLRFRAKPMPAEEAERLIALVREGGAVARICNRVDDAQEIYKALLALNSSAETVLLHARFPLHRREERERRIDELVGKDSQRTQDQGIIVVGTQVLEQSLDYDVDVMISDFAPIDLLLQRAGRLQRHQRARPHQHQQPMLQVLLPLTESGLPDWRRWAPIYDPYILWRSWEVLREGMSNDEREIVLPRDYRTLIEAVYHDKPVLPEESAYQQQMADAWEKLTQAQSEQERLANKQLTPRSDLADPITRAADIIYIEDEAGQLAGWQVAKTRLGDRITVVPVYSIEGELFLNSDRYSGWGINQPIDLETQKSILRHSLSISDKEIISEFRDDRRRDLRWPWGEVPALLRSIYPLPLRPNHTAEFDRRLVRLDQALGLVIDKEVL